MLWLDQHPLNPSSVAMGVTDLKDPDRPCLLTVAHAVGACSPGGMQGATHVYGHSREASPMPVATHAKHVGEVIRSLPLPGAVEARVDAAIVRLDPSVTVTRRVPDGKISPELWDLTDEDVDITDDVPVFEVGATTALTAGTLACKPGRERVHDPGSGVVRRFQPTYLVIPDEEGVDFGAGGDSGSVVVRREDMRPVAMLIAMRTQGDRPRLGVTIPLVHVLSALDVKF